MKHVQYTIAAIAFLLLPLAATGQDTIYIDGMIVWSQQADSAEDMAKVSQYQINAMNTALRNTNLPVKIRLVYSGKIDYDEGTIGSDVSYQNLKRGAGKLSEVHRLRDFHGADLVCLILVNPGLIGRSNSWHYAGPNPQHAFAALRLKYCDNPLLAHEWGHNLGCAHGHGESQSTQSDAHEFSHGYRFSVGGTERRTIMCTPYSTTKTVLQYSSPFLFYEGVPTGAEGSADNALSIMRNAPHVAQYRHRPNLEHPLPETPPEAVPVSVQ